MSDINWAYGVTTVPARRNNLLPRTLASLAASGFDFPRLFVDGDTDLCSWQEQFRCDVSCRYPAIRTYGNWYLALAELYIRNSKADRYAIFQDDLVCVRDMRAYLDAVPFPTSGYLNLYTFPPPRQAEPPPYTGFFPSNQKGKGAVALVFNLGGVTGLLTSQLFVSHPNRQNYIHQRVDGGIVDSLHRAGFTEYIHNPSLVQHTGDVSAMGHSKYESATTFPGEEFSALELLSSNPALVLPDPNGDRTFLPDTIPVTDRDEIRALERAIKDDKERLKTEVSRGMRGKYNRYIEAYTGKLIALRRQYGI